MPKIENISGAYASKRPRPGRTMVTTGGPGGVPKVKLTEPKRDFAHLPTESQILRSMTTKQRRAYDKANKAQRKKMLAGRR